MATTIMSELSAYTVDMPMARSFGHAANTRHNAESLVLKYQHAGITANGECAPRHYVTGETLASVAAELAQVDWRRYRAGLESADPAAVLQQLLTHGMGELLGELPRNNTCCALELLAIDVLGKRLQTSVLAHLAGTTGEHAQQPFTQVKDAALSVDEFLASRGPFHVVKVKATANFAEDLAVLDRLRAALGPQTAIIFDVNMAWSLDEALVRCKALRERQVNIVEEPLPARSFSALAQLQRRTGIEVMLDESLCDLGDAVHAVEQQSCAHFNLRVAKLGGIGRALELARFADKAGIGYQVGVQVAECATLIDAGRTLSFLLPKAFTREAGQSDLFFPAPVARPSSQVDRIANVITAPVDIGFGTLVTPAISHYQHTRYL
ncbi:MULTISPECIES: enolase C-terminal domain-like protein [Pseudomonas]|uniref:enolase C-terminal domain-like protein n=1 Tax=Pseudomonas TaxID=286 RepID=UPI0030DCC63C